MVKADFLRELGRALTRSTPAFNCPGPPTTKKPGLWAALIRSTPAFTGTPRERRADFAPESSPVDESEMQLSIDYHAKRNYLESVEILATVGREGINAWESQPVSQAVRAAGWLLSYHNKDWSDVTRGTESLSPPIPSEAAAVIVDMATWMQRGANFGGQQMGGTFLRGAKLPRANFRGTTLRASDLRNADLSFAELSSADLESAFLDGADLGHAKLRGAHLAGAHLWRARLQHCVLTQADLRAAWLNGAVLENAQLAGALLPDLIGVNLRGADLRGCDISLARIQDSDLRGAIWNRDTKWPPAIESEIQQRSVETEPGRFEVDVDSGGDFDRRLVRSY